MEKGVKIFDTRNQCNLQDLKVHEDKIVNVEWHPFLPIINTCSNDHTSKLLISSNYLNEYK